jgi:hypothetical protein
MAKGPERRFAMGPEDKIEALVSCAKAVAFTGPLEESLAPMLGHSNRDPAPIHWKRTRAGALLVTQRASAFSQVPDRC